MKEAGRFIFGLGIALVSIGISLWVQGDVALESNPKGKAGKKAKWIGICLFIGAFIFLIPGFIALQS